MGTARPQDTMSSPVWSGDSTGWGSDTNYNVNNFFTVSLGNTIGSTLIQCFCRNVPEPDPHWPSANNPVMANYGMFTGLDSINKSLFFIM